MEPTRRRGRPPGAKNRPKPDYQFTSVSSRDVVDLTKPLPGANMYYPELQSLTTTFPIHLDCQSAFGDSRSWSEDGEWPADWPLPQNGANVVGPSGKGGQVIGITYDLHQHRIHMRLT